MRFYVNVDHVATIRQARRADEPDPLEAALASIDAGADGITVHLREDRRHIQDDDVRRLAARGGFVLNLELASAPDIISLTTELRPYQATFVPERREEVTTEGGLRVLGADGNPDPRLRDAMAAVAEAGVRTSLFIDPDLPSVEASAALGADAIEIHTGEYANAFPRADAQLARIREAALAAKGLGLAVHAGHGLTIRNVTQVAEVEPIEELNIGHSLVSRAVIVGIGAAVAEMRRIIDGAR